MGGCAAGAWNRDTVVAIVMLAVWAAFWHASGEIELTDYGPMTSDIWPRIILTILTALTLLYLVQSLRGRIDREDERVVHGGIGGFLSYYRNPIIIFALFFAFLVTLPVFGMLLGGAIYVFLSLTAIGGWSRRQLVRHAVIAVLSIGTMWLIFTYGLGVLLPEGMLVRLN